MKIIIYEIMKWRMNWMKMKIMIYYINNEKKKRKNDYWINKMKIERL